MDTIRIVIILPGRNDPDDHLAAGLEAARAGVRARRYDDMDAAWDDLADADVVMSFGSLIDDRLFGHARRLRWFQVLGSGTDGIFDRPDVPSDLIVTSARGVTAIPVAETAMAYLLHLARDIGTLVRDQQQRLWRRRLPTLLGNKRLLVIGTGAAARALATRAHAFGMRVTAVSASPRPIVEFDAVVPRTALPEQAARTDFVVVLAALDQSTRGMVSAEVIGNMPDGAALVDLSRGGVTDRDALHDALHAGRLRGAVLDVFPDEPLAPAAPDWTVPGLLVSPHIAGAHDAYAQWLLPLLTGNLVCFGSGKFASMVNLVDKQQRPIDRNNSQEA